MSKLFFFIFVCLFSTKAVCQTDEGIFQKVIPLLQNKCDICHDASTNPTREIKLLSQFSSWNNREAQNYWVRSMLHRLNLEPGSEKYMPRLDWETDEQRQIVLQWLSAGAPDEKGESEINLADTEIFCRLQSFDILKGDLAKGIYFSIQKGEDFRLSVRVYNLTLELLVSESSAGHLSASARTLGGSSRQVFWSEKDMLFDDANQLVISFDVKLRNGETKQKSVELECR